MAIIRQTCLWVCRMGDVMLGMFVERKGNGRLCELIVFRLPKWNGGGLPRVAVWLAGCLSMRTTTNGTAERSARDIDLVLSDR